MLKSIYFFLFYSYLSHRHVTFATKMLKTFRFAEKRRYIYKINFFPREEELANRVHLWKLSRDKVY